MYSKRLLHSFAFLLLCFAFTNCGSGFTASTNNSSGGTAGGGTTGGGTSGGTAAPAEFVYVVNGASLAGYQVSSTGSLTSLGTLQSSSQLRFEALTASPDGKFLYSFDNPCIAAGNCSTGATYRQDNRILVQATRADGTLDAPVAVVNADQFPVDLAISPNSKFAFVLSGSTLNKVTVYPINANGTFGASTGSVQLPQPIISDSEGGRAYPSLGGFTGGNTFWVGEIISYRSGSEPHLVSITFDANSGAVSGNKVTDLITQSEVESLTTTATNIVTAEGMEWTFISPNTTSVFANNNGTAQLLTKCTTSDNANCGRNVRLAGSQKQPFVFAINYPTDTSANFKVVGFNVGDNGTLTSQASTTTFPGSNFVDLDVDAAAKFVFLSNRDAKTLTSLSVNQTNASVTTAGSATTSGSPGAVASVVR